MTERERVYVQIDDGSMWCARHWGVLVRGAYRCWVDSEDDGACQPVPLYVEAPDP